MQTRKLERELFPLFDYISLFMSNEITSNVQITIQVMFLSQISKKHKRNIKYVLLFCSGFNLNIFPALIITFYILIFATFMLIQLIE